MIPRELFIKMAIDGWQAQLNGFNSLLDELSDNQIMEEVAPGRNRGIYLLGHLIAVHDLMLPLLRFEKGLYPELKPIFLDAPDKLVRELPSISQLRKQWKTVNEKLINHFNTLPGEEWFIRHANVSEEDFNKEPHRNRLNVLLSRTNHLSNHRGQFAFLIKKS
ncbi:MAG: hypothetical protein NVS1B13_08710 [Flavisolibacter sp.]